MPLAAGQDLVHPHDALAQHVLGDTLQVDVERRVDVEGVRDAGQPRQLLRERLPDQVHEVGRLRLQGALHHLHGLAAHARGRRRRDEAGVGHRTQDDVPALAGPFRRVEGRPYGGRLDGPGNRGGLGERDVADVFPEEQARRFRDAVHGERATLPQVHVVQVELEDLVLRCLPFEDERHELLEQFPAPGPLSGCGLARERLGEEEIPGELLRQRAGALEVPALAAEVGDECSRHPHGIDPRVVIKSAILDGEDRLHHARRYRREWHLPPLLAAGAQERGKQRGVQGDAVGGRSARFDAPDAARRGGGAPGVAHARLLEEDAHGLAVAVAAAGDDGNRSGTDRELASLFDSRPLRVPQIVQPVDDLGRAERLTLAQFERARKHSRQHALPLSVEPRLDLPGEGHVVVAENRTQQDGWNGDRDGQVHGPAAPPPSRSGSPA